jgi:DNA-binding XRE family transcriptional regulator
VQAADDSHHFATARMRFMDSFPRPYSVHVDRDKIKKRRVERHLNQSQLGALIGQHQTNISRFERNRWDPSDEVIEQIAAALSATVADFRKDAHGAGA